MPSTPQPAKGTRRLFIAGNWKMYKTVEEARSLAGEIAKGVPATERIQVAVFPPAVALTAVVEGVRGARPAIVVGAQNAHFEKEGAFTGEISMGMIAAAGATAVILGHSERRHTFGEPDDLVAKKVLAALGAGLVPVFCVGEKLGERESGATFQVVERQLAAVTAALSSLQIEKVEAVRLLRKVIVAYEPVWAIGTGKTATPAQGQEVHAFLREQVRKAFVSLGGPEAAADECQILYGGSVKPENAKELLAEPDIDGLLVGGASLKADSFLKICSAGL